MPSLTQLGANPRKSPVQARSAATVEAILTATAQVLLQVGKERLTTTLVAQRAGVSVGTLYQYFGDKQELLQAALARHLDEITLAIEQVCTSHHGCPLPAMATALVNAFFEAKLKDHRVSVSFYAVSSDVDGAATVRQKSARSHRAIVTMLGTAPERLTSDAEIVATVLQGVLVGVSRRLLEGTAPHRRAPALQAEIILLMHAYLAACSLPA